MTGAPGVRSLRVALMSVIAVTTGSSFGAGQVIEPPATVFSFAVVGTSSGDPERSTATLLRAIDAGPSRFTVHFDVSSPSEASCSDAALARRRAQLDASGKPIVPVVAGSEWAACGTLGGEPLERLIRLGDALFGNDETLGRAPMPWVRQSAMPRFHRYRENARWQVGRVLFATINLPDNNNNYRLAAGRNGEFEERVVANRAWLERTFRIATERRLEGVVLFVDAAPRFAAPMHVPDPRSRERDGYYEWKAAVREVVATFNGQVLLVQARPGPNTPAPGQRDQPLLDAAGRPVPNFSRIVLDASDGTTWLRVDVDARDPALFRMARERMLDDPTGELYGRVGTSPTSP